MRRFLGFLVLLLILRGGIGAAMAGQMLALELGQAQAAATAAQQAAAHPPDCPGHVATADAPAMTLCSSCLHCDAASLPALVPQPAMLPQRFVHALPTAPPVRFADAEPQPAIDPPIS
jgi:hypothetical protein